jgi:hypothetical protein
MRGRRWLLIGNLGLGSCLVAGCLRAALPPQGQRPPSISNPPPIASSQARPSAPPSDYLVSQTSARSAGVQSVGAAVKNIENPAAQSAASSIPNTPSDHDNLSDPKESARPDKGKPVEPVELRIQEEPASPTHPPDPPPHLEIHPVSLTRPDAPPVQVLRGLLDHRPEEEINEQLKPYDPATREVLLLLLSSVVQLEESGGLTRISPRHLAAWTERLHTLTASLRSRSQLILERMCFCSYINNFGDFAPLPPEHSFFHPGELAHVYVQARNLSSRRQGDKYVTVLKARLEIYDENSRDTPPIIWNSLPREDVSASPRQDYYINFRYSVPLSLPAGLYTLRITVEDWTDAPPGAKQVPEWRIARCTLDFRVGGPIARPARHRIAEAVPH